MKSKNLIANLAGLCGLLLLSSCSQTVPPPVDDMSMLHPERQTGFANGGWNIDRYKDLSTLDAGKRMVLADLEGPGIITHIHTTRMNPNEFSARGIVLEIWFDDAEEPAVQSPLADFFGDGCNGESINFSTPLIESVPWAYNCYFRMPFSKNAKVILRNDTKRDFMNYSYVEWESLPKWNPKLGYFHATYRRDVFQLNKETDHMFFEIKGSGHIIGRQFSVTTDEPLFRSFGYVMEGNNEVDIDGQERRIDYLGTEDSYTFSWGFRDQFTGMRAGMPLIVEGKTSNDVQKLSIYRFHDHMPIRFNESLSWHINWTMERLFNNNDPLEKFQEKAVQYAENWEKALAREGCWMDYAHVFYWYQDQPGGFKHQPLGQLEERMKPLLRSSIDIAKSKDNRP